MPLPVANAIIEYLEHEMAYGGYETARKYHLELEKTYQAVANLINADSDEIAILENATAAWNVAFLSIDFNDGDRILTSVSEYASNFIAYLRLQKEVDVHIDVIPCDEYGQASVEKLKTMMDSNVKLISITHIPTNSGLVNPVEEIGKVAAQYKCLYLVDACQSVGQYPVDVKEIGCDMLSATGRKYLRGPRGTGFLYVNKEKLQSLDPPFLDLNGAEWVAENQYKVRDDARRFENWETNYAGVMGLKKAVEYADEIGISNIWSRVTALGEQLRWELEKHPNIKVRDIGEKRCGLVTFTIDSQKAGEMQDKLAKENINVSVSRKSSTLMDMRNRKLEEVVRASLHYYNTTAEIEQFIQTLNHFAS